MKSSAFAMMTKISFLILSVFVFFALNAHAADKRVTAPVSANVPIWIIGDSTVADYAQSDKRRGWGQVITELLKNGERVVNRARSGASSKSFIAVVNAWSSNAFWGDGATKSKYERSGVKEDIAKADTSSGGYLLIQFGHNDSFQNNYRPEVKTVPGLGNEFDKFLMGYIKHARAHNVTPVLVTPMARMFKNSLTDAYSHRVESLSGVPEPWQKMNGKVGDWPQTMKEVGRREGVIVLDLTSKSKDHFATFSSNQKIKDLYSWNQKDPTHFNQAGAKKMAELIRDLAHETSPALAAQFKKAKTSPSPR